MHVRRGASATHDKKSGYATISHSQAERRLATSSHRLRRCAKAKSPILGRMPNIEIPESDPTLDVDQQGQTRLEHTLHFRTLCTSLEIAVFFALPQAPLDEPALCSSRPSARS